MDPHDAIAPRRAISNGSRLSRCANRSARRIATGGARGELVEQVQRVRFGERIRTLFRPLVLSPCAAWDTPAPIAATDPVPPVSSWIAGALTDTSSTSTS
jgi:hypothetical protein